jgi:hypothetical protein
LACQRKGNTDGVLSAEKHEEGAEMEEQMKQVLNFLHNPVENGVYHQRTIIEGRQILNFWKYLRDHSKKIGKRFNIDEPSLDLDMEDIGEAGKWWLTQDMEEMLNFLFKLKICPVQVKEWAQYGEAVLVPEYAEELAGNYFFLAQKAYTPESLDAFSIEVEPRAYPNLVIDVIGLTPTPLENFRSFIESIPIVGKKALFTKEQKRHAEKYTSVLYPSVAALWVDYIARLVVSGDLVELLEGAMDYFYTRDWRTSILLSAISVEKLLAEFYEEVFKRPCPPMPIGDIQAEISKFKNLPKEANDAWKTTNTMRNAAVHRSYMPLTLKEATDALRGAVTFILWFSEHGTEFYASPNNS